MGEPREVLDTARHGQGMRLHSLKMMVILAALLLPSVITAQAAVKAGVTCPVKGASKAFQGKKFICIQSGKKLAS